MIALEKTLMAPGVYPDVPFEEYARWSALNYSTLKWFAKSAKHGRYHELTAQEETGSQRLGDAADAAILTPDRFDELYLARPAFDGHPNSKAHKESRARWEDENRDKVILSQPELERAKAIREAVRGHALANGLICRSRGRTQLSFVWHDRETGLLCKGRIDRLCLMTGPELRGPCVVDLKTSNDPTPSGFPREVAKYSYHLQAAMYLEGLAASSPGARKYLLVAVENEEPYDVVVHELLSPALENGSARFRRLIRTYKECLDSGRWPGSCETVNFLILPKWAEETEA